MMVKGEIDDSSISYHPKMQQEQIIFSDTEGRIFYELIRPGFEKHNDGSSKIKKCRARTDTDLETSLTNFFKKR